MFRFKHFKIDDSLSAMKIGTDGVLLGAHIVFKEAESVLYAALVGEVRLPCGVGNNGGL